MKEVCGQGWGLPAEVLMNSTEINSEIGREWEHLAI